MKNIVSHNKRNIILFAFIALLLQHTTSQIIQNENFGNIYLVTNESSGYDLSEYFTGYNLSYNTNGSATISPKSQLLNQLNSTFQVNTFNIPHNSFGYWDTTQNVTMLDSNNTLYWGSLSNSTSVPNIIGSLKLTNDSTIACLSSRNLQGGYALIDCTQNLTGSTQQQNYLYVVNLNNSTITSITQTTSLVNYPTISSSIKRWLVTTQVGTTYYIFRATPANTLGNQSNNSYVEVFTLSNLSLPATSFKVFDRNALNQSTLTLVGFDNVGTDIFLMDASGITYRITSVQINNPTPIVYTYQAPEAIVAGTCAPDFTVPAVKLLVASATSVYSIDWTTAATPMFVERFYIGPNVLNSVLRLDESNNYLYLLGTISNSSQAGLMIFRKDQKFLEEIYYYSTFTYTNNMVDFDLNRDTDNILLYNGNQQFVNYQIQRSLLLFANLQTTQENSLNLTVTDSYQNNLTVTINYNVIKPDDVDTYYTGSNNITDFTFLYPSTILTPISGYFSGPALEYTPELGDVFAYEDLNLTNDIPRNFTNVYYILFKKHLDVENQYFLFMQIDNYNLVFQTCDYDSLPKTLTCTLVFNTTLNETIKELVFSTTNVLITLNYDPNLYTYNFSGALINKTAMPSPGCADLAVSYNPLTPYQYCSGNSEIYVFQENGATTQINSSTVQGGLPSTFSPTQLLANPNYPSYLFSGSYDGIYIFNIFNAPSNVFYLESYIPINATILASNLFSIQISGNSIVLVSQAVNQIYEYDITDINNPYLRKVYSSNYSQGISWYNLGFVSSSMTNNFLVTGIDSNSDTYIYGFKSGQTANGNLIGSVKLGVQSQVPVYAAMDYTDDGLGDIAIVTVTNMVHAVMLYSDPMWLLDAEIEQLADIYESANYTFQARSVLDTGLDSEELTFNISIFNGEPTLRVFNPQSEDLESLYGYKANSTYMVNDAEFLVGYAMDYEVSASNPNETQYFTLIPKVNQTDSFLDITNLMFYASAIGQNYNYLQTNNTIIVMNKEQVIQSYVPLSFQYVNFNEEICNRLAINQEELFSVSTCYDPSSSIYYLVFISYLSSSPSVLGVIPTTISNVNQIKLVNNWLFILESNSTSYLGSDSRIHVYEVTLGDAEGEITTYYGFADGSIFNTDMLQASGFDIAALTYGDVRVFVSDAEYGIRTADWSVSKYTWVNVTSTNPAQSQSFYGAFIPSNVVWSGIIVAYTQNDYYHELILISENYNSYYLSWVLGYQGAFAITEALQGYLNSFGGSFTNKYRFINDFVVMVASLSTEDVAVVYSTSNSSNGRNISNLTHIGPIGNPTYLTVTGDADPLALFLDPTTNNTKLWVPNFGNSAGIIAEYILKVDLTIQISPNATNLTSYWLELNAINPYDTLSVGFNLQNVPLSPSQPIPGSVPTVQNIQGLKPLTISQDETLIIDLSNYAIGNNITSNITDQESALTLNNQLFTHLGWNIVAVDIPLDPFGNWDLFNNVTIIDESNTLWWSGLASCQSLPNLTFGYSFQFDSNSETYCFDVNSLPGNIALIDCYSPDQEEDYFNIVNLNNNGLTTITYPQLTSITNYNNPNSRILKYSTWNSVNYVYRILTTYANEGNPDLQQLSYVEIWIMTNSTSIQYYTTIDFTKLNLNGLYITDCDVNNGDIFIADQRGYAIRISNYFTSPTNMIVQIVNITDTLSSIKAISETINGQQVLTVLIGGNNTVYQYDWTNFAQPNLNYTYQVAPYQVNMIDLDASPNFIYVFTQDNQSNRILVQAYSRAIGSNQNENLVYSVYESTQLGNNSFLVVNRGTDTYMLISQPVFETLTISPFMINIIGNASLFPNFNLKSYNATSTFILQVDVISPDNFNITTPNATPPVSIPNPTVHSLTVPLGQVFQGPLLGFDVANSQPSTLYNSFIAVASNTSTIPEVEITNSLNLNTSLNSTQIYFQSAQVGYTNNLLYFAQIDQYSLTMQNCSLDHEEDTLNCLLTAQTSNLSGPVQSIALTSTYIIVNLVNNTNLTVFDYNFNLITTQQMTSPCSDITYTPNIGSSGTLFCIQASNSSINVYDVSSIIQPNMILLMTINQNTPVIANMAGLSSFSPVSVVFMNYYPSMIFIQTTTQTIILNAGLVYQGVLNYISSIPFNQISNPSLVISGTSLELISQQSNLIQEWDISTINQPYMRKNYVTYYNYQLNVSNSQYSSTIQNNNFYVCAMQNNVPQILVFTAGALANNNLYALLNFTTDVTTISITAYSMSSSADIVFVATNQGISAYIVYTQPTMFYDFYFENHNDPYEVKSFSVTGYSSLAINQTSKTLTFNFSAVNTEFEINCLINGSSVTLDSLQNITLNQTLSFALYDQDFFNGTILGYGIATQNPSDQQQFSLAGHISQNTTLNITDSVIHQVINDTDSETTYYLTDSKLISVNSSQNGTYTLQILTDNTQKCFRMTLINITSGPAYIVAGCQDTNNLFYLYLINITNGATPAVVSQLPTILENINEIIVKGTDIWILESDPKEIPVTSTSRIHLFQFNATSQTISYQTALSSNVVNTVLAIGGFDLVPLASNTGYRLFFTNFDNSIYTIDYNSNNNSWGNFTNTSCLNSSTFANSYLISNIAWNGIMILSASNENNVDLLISSYNYHTYKLNWNQAQNQTQLILMQTYLTYNGYTLTNQLIQTASNLFILGFETQNQYSGHVLVYNLTSPDFVLGVINFTYSDLMSNVLQAYVNPADNITKVWVSNDTKGQFDVYDIKNYLNLTIQMGTISSSYITLTASNSYISSSVNLPLTFIILNGPSSGLAWWIILLIVLGVLIIAALVVFGYKKYKSNKDVSSNEPMIPTIKPEDDETVVNQV